MLLLRLSIALGITLASLTAGPSPATADELLTPGAHVPADCSTDVSAALQQFFDEVPDGATVELQPDGCYRIDTEIRVASKDRLTLDGRGATLRRDTTERPTDPRYHRANAMLRFGDLTNSSITGLHVRGVNTQSDVPDKPRFGAWRKQRGFDHGIALVGAQNVTLEDTTIEAVFGDGVYIGGSDTHAQARDVRVRDVTIDRNGRQAIAITSAEGVLIDDVTIAHSRRAGIDMEPHPGKTVSDVEIRHSRFTTRLLAVTGSGVGEVSNVFVHHNTFLASALPLVHNHAKGRGGRQNWRVIENEVSFVVRSSAPAMSFGNTRDVLVHGNRINFELGSGLAVTVGRSEVVVACNRFTGAIENFVTADRHSVVELDRNSRTAETPQCPTPALTAASGEQVDERSADPTDSSAAPETRRATTSQQPRPEPSPTAAAERPKWTRAQAAPAQRVETKKHASNQDRSQLMSDAADNRVQDWATGLSLLVMLAVAAFGLAGLAGRRRSGRHAR